MKRGDEWSEEDIDAFERRVDVLMHIGVAVVAMSIVGIAVSEAVRACW